jgi:DNA modification methylase
MNTEHLVSQMKRSIGVKRVEVEGKNYKCINNDCCIETANMSDNSVDLILTSIPFSNHYEYTPLYNDFGHNDGNETFFKQMDYLTPNLLRVLRPGRICAVHVKDRILFGNVTGDGMPTVDPFSDMTVMHFINNGFRYMGRIIVLTDVVRENNQTYRLGWTENCKDGSKMGIGCPEYILLFRKLPTDTSKAYADEPVVKSKEDYTRAQWQLDAHAFWRSSGDRLVTKEEIQNADPSKLQKLYRRYSKDNIYSYDEHVALAKKLDESDRLPATFMVCAPGSWSMDIWDDINRMCTLNTSQSARRQQMHVCPLQLDIIERIIKRYTNEGDIVYDPFGGLMSVPMSAVKMGRYGIGTEISADYFRDGVGYCQEAEQSLEKEPTLFDIIDMVPAGCET